MRKIGLEFLGAFGLPPVDLVHLAADLDCQFITTILAPIDYNPEGYAKWSLRDDARLRGDLKSALLDRGVELTLGDGIAILPDIDVREAYVRDLDLYQELGVKRVNSLTFDPSLERSYDQFAHVAEMVSERGMEPTLEFCPISVINDLAAAVEAVRHAGPHAKVLVDTMHFFRSGSSVEELQALAPGVVGHIQLCDVPRHPTIPDYLEEAMYERRAPGDGDAPLVEILAALPQVQCVGLEIPLRSLAEQGVGVRDRMARCVAGARRVIAQADRGT